MLSRTEVILFMLRLTKSFVNLYTAAAGIAMEGLTCMLAGIWGSGVGTTSYSENIAAIGITKVYINMLTFIYIYICIYIYITQSS